MLKSLCVAGAKHLYGGLVASGCFDSREGRTFGDRSRGLSSRNLEAEMRGSVNPLRNRRSGLEVGPRVMVR